MGLSLYGPCETCGAPDAHPYLDGPRCETCRPLIVPPAGPSRVVTVPRRDFTALVERASNDYVRPGRGVTSHEAARRALPRSGTQRRIILDALAAAYEASGDGATDVELARHLNLSPNSVRPRRGELVELWLVADSGRVRKHHGADHVVWIVTADAVSALRSSRS